ncbi:hypothetical protein Emag_007846 [Eimeria magna]
MGSLGGCLLAPRARYDEEGSDEVVEARPALPTPVSSGVSAELEVSAELFPLPAARVPGSARAAPQPTPTSPAAPPPVGPIGQAPLPPLFPTTTSAASAQGDLASQGWDIMATRCVWWTLAAAREYKMARESFEYRLQELWAKLVSGPGRPDAPGAVRGPGGDGGSDGVFGRVLVVQRGAASRSHGPGRTSLRKFLSGVYRTGEALLGTAVATSISSRLGAAPAAPRGPSAFAPPTRPDSPSALPGAPEETTPPPPMPDLRAEEFRLPGSSATARDPPQQLGMDRLLDGSPSR